MQVEFVTQILLRAYRVVVVGIWGKELALALRAGSQGRSLVHVLQDDQRGSIGHGGKQCGTVSGSAPLSTGRWSRCDVWIYRHAPLRKQPFGDIAPILSFARTKRGGQLTMYTLCRELTDL